AYLPEPLATEAAARAQQHLHAASEAVREAAGGPISETTSTLTVHSDGEGSWLRLPVHLVTAVDQVLVDGDPVLDWRLVNGRLWRAAGGGRSDQPTPVEVTCTHGYPEVPEPVRVLVIQLALVAAQHIEDDGLLGPTPGVRQESISATAYAVTFGSDDPVPSTVFEINDRTRRWLRTSYGPGAAAMVGSQ
ncbi:hypothetical protein, partial [uncultured Reyranella sp.]|uniref:hypothetical protein n=1 Tax=uncultured Reyranella sp. TaxID=735512 RepID=UPI00259C9B3A